MRPKSQNGGKDGGANFSKDGRYRYTLERRMRSTGTHGVFIALNPSTADAETDDPTIRRITGFAQSFGHGRLTVVNLYAYRATHPQELLNVADPVGARNEDAVRTVLKTADQIIACLGCSGIVRRLPDSPVEDLLKTRRDVACLGTTMDGTPRHPLYLPKDTRTEPWP